MKRKTIRIGTRDSNLALWQAKLVEKKLIDLGYNTEIIAIKSQGDIILNKPLYELGITGIFTKNLDVALLNNTIDIAVHSMKDVPTILPKDIVQGAVLKRGNSSDVLVYKENLDFLTASATIATGSLRRKAQWLHKYSQHHLVDLRGNVNTRLQKLKDNNWSGAIFAKAGLERLDFIIDDANNNTENKSKIISNNTTFLSTELEWMIPAPAQGAIVIATLQNQQELIEALKEINDTSTEICTHIERSFLNTLEGGCTAPIGAIAVLNNNVVCFKGALFSLNGKESIIVKKKCTFDNYFHFGKECAKEILESGGKNIMKNIKKEQNLSKN